LNLFIRSISSSQFEKKKGMRMTIEFRTRIGPGYVTTPTFTSMNFPAGEAHIKIVNENDHNGPLTEVARVYGYNAQDLMTVAMWANAAHQRSAKTVLLLPYLPGARQDRGLPFGAKVYSNLINAMNLNQVICFDPHSPVMPELISNLTIIGSAPLIRHHIVGRPDSDQRAQRYNGIIAPDAGATARAQHVADLCGLPLYQALKHRDEATGQLSGFSCETLPKDGKYLVVDDICDGGRTFTGLAEATGLPADQLGLYVSHGVFSGRAGQLTERFSEIWTTDSYPAQNDIGAKTIPLNIYLTGAIK
jgi:ribose-phosphate pyrophosphokinase